MVQSVVPRHPVHSTTILTGIGKFLVAFTYGKSSPMLQARQRRPFYKIGCQVSDPSFVRFLYESSFVVVVVSEISRAYVCMIFSHE